jgi:predicted DNA-binding ribbon-helix-helix protein
MGDSKVVKRKGTSTTIRLYPKTLQLLRAIAKDREVTQADVIAEGIRLYARHFKYEIPKIPAEGG